MMSKKRNSISKKDRASKEWYQFNSSEWQVIVPATTIFLWGMLSLAVSASGEYLPAPGENIVAVLLLVFGLLAIFQTTRREAISNYTRIVIWSLAITTALATTFWLGDTNGSSCLGLMSEQVSCTDNNRFIITVLLRNPFSITATAIIVISGIISILTSSSKSRA